MLAVLAPPCASSGQEYPSRPFRVVVPYVAGGARQAPRDYLRLDTVITSVPQIRAGKLRAFAVSSSERASALAEVPTMQEAGIAGFDISQWQGFLAPPARRRTLPR